LYIHKGNLGLVTTTFQEESLLPVKVLMVIPYLAPSYGGTSKVVIELANSLGQMNQSVDVVTTTASGTERLDVMTGDWVEQNNIRVRYFPTWYRNDLIFSPALLLWLSRHLKEYDVVHTHTLFSPLITLVHRLCRWNKVPYIITPHGMLQPWALAYKGRKKRVYYQALEKVDLQLASAVHVLASSEVEDVHSLGIKQSLRVPNGIHPDDFVSPPAPEAFYHHFPQTRNQRLILFLGRIDPKKGLDLLAQAFSQVRACVPDAHLVVAGPDSIGFMPTVQNYFAQAKCLDAVTFTGMLTGELKQAALAAATAYVAPSYSEGFSMSVLEGMASGLPCVITTGCNFPEAATHSAAKVVDIDASAIGGALVECLQESTAKTLGDRAKAFILQHYTWEQSAKKLIQAYSSILQEQDSSDLISAAEAT